MPNPDRLRPPPRQLPRLKVGQPGSR
jgi:hypothetical protein